MTTNDLDAIRRLAEAADRAPWTAHDDGLVWAERIGDPVSGSAEQPNAEFIAAAITHVPNLCDEVEQLRAELAANEGSEDARLTIAERKVEQLRAELAKAAEQNTAAWIALNKAGFQSPVAGIAELIDELAAALADAEGRGTALAALLTKSREQAAKVHEQNAAAQNALRSLGQAYADLKTDNDELAASAAKDAVVEADDEYCNYGYPWGGMKPRVNWCGLKRGHSGLHYGDSSTVGFDNTGTVRRGVKKAEATR